MSKIAWVCGLSLSMAFLASACSDSDETPTGSTGGRAGAGGGSAGASRGGNAGAGEAPGEGGTPNGEAGDSSAGAANGGSAGDDGVAGQAGAPAGTTNCLPDATTLQVTASGTSAYVFGGLPAAWSDGAGDKNAPLTLCRGFTYTFALNVTGHPFYIKTAAGIGTANAYATGVTTNGATTGNLTFAVPADAPAALFYQCQFHAPMTSTITIVDPN
jgi:hypothetical protein